ncbi:MAG: hypothetical protein ACUVRV_06505 [Cyanobacteriota bacterium]
MSRATVAPLNQNKDAQGQQVRHILVAEDTKRRRTLFLEAATYSIGRDPASAIILNSNFVFSNFVFRQHAILLRMLGLVVLHY